VRVLLRPWDRCILSQPLWALSLPLKHLKASINTLTAYKHFQGLCSLQALSWLVIENSIELSHGCESVVEAVRVLYAYSLFGHPCDLYMHSHGLYSTLTTSTGTCMASSTLSRPILGFSVPHQHSYSFYNNLKTSVSTLTVSTNSPTSTMAWSKPLQHSRRL